MAHLLALLLVGCGSQSTPSTPEATPELPVVPEEPAKAEAPADGDGIPEKGVYFKAPADGATVTSPVHVEMGVAGMAVQPAGQKVEGTGHHHIIVDADPIGEGETVPKNEQHIHYGDGSTETELELAPGKHTLRLQFADGLHASYGEDWSTMITVTVEEGDAGAAGSAEGAGAGDAGGAKAPAGGKAKAKAKAH